MSKVDISVVIPCYESELTIENVIELIKDTLKDRIFEIICVNDNSKDNTLLILKKLCKKYSEVYIFYLEWTSKGQGRCRKSHIRRIIQKKSVAQMSDTPKKLSVVIY